MSTLDGALASIENLHDPSIPVITRLLAQEKIDPNLTSDKLGIFEVEAEKKFPGREKLGIFFVELLKSLLTEERKLYSPDHNKLISPLYKEANKPPTEAQRNEIKKRGHFSELVTYLSRIFYFPESPEERQKILKRYGFNKTIIVYSGPVENKKYLHHYEFKSDEKTEEFPNAILRVTDDTEINTGSTLTIDSFPLLYSHYPGLEGKYGLKLDGRDPNDKEVLADISSKIRNGLKNDLIDEGVAYAKENLIEPHLNFTLTDSAGHVKSELKGKFVVEDKDTFGFEFKVPELPDLKFFVPIQRFGTNLPPTIQLINLSDVLFDLVLKKPENPVKKKRKLAQKVPIAV